MARSPRAGHRSIFRRSGNRFAVENATKHGIRQNIFLAARTAANRNTSLLLALAPLADRETHEAGDLDRAADLAFGFFQRLGDRLGRIVDIGLLEQAGLLVEGLEPRFDDLGNDIVGLALLAELVGHA